MALDVSRAKTEIDVLAKVHQAEVDRRDRENADLKEQLAVCQETIEDLRHQLETAVPPPGVPGVPAVPVRWGSSVERQGTETFRGALGRVEAGLGRLDVVRYFRPGTGGPSWNADLDGLEGRSIVYSAKSPPALVLSGGADQVWRTWFGKAVGYLERWPGARADWTQWHEPEDNVEAGAFTAAQWRDSVRRLIGIQKKEFGHPRLFADTILMGYTLSAPKRRVEDWLVEEADVWAWDSYIGLAAKDPVSAVGPFEKLARERGKTWAVAETGVSAGTPDRAAVLTALARRLATASPLPAYVTYFDSDPGGPSEYRWPISGDPKLAAAWLAGRAA